MILVNMDNKRLPISSLGTGIHEVIILATAATFLENSILCVEEPELHLHPLLQKKLIHYLSEHTSNQYFFTTHSAHLLDAVDDIAIFHVRHDAEKTTVGAIETSNARFNVCSDLGYKASDLLQANCIIWVEGPSDRIYLNKWLKSTDSNLVEGVHYSIMFYGGRLFSHLTAEDPEDREARTTDFISVRKLNRQTCIVFDSDKSKSGGSLNATKRRLKREFDKGPGFTWVTKGREIENYIDPNILEGCVKHVHPSAGGLIGKSEWSNTLKYTKKRTSETRTADKVKVARYYDENHDPDLGVLDLKAQINKLRKFVYESNGLQAP